MPEGLPMLMDRAYEGAETRQLVLDLGMIPVVPPKSNRLNPWDYDHAVYKKRNENRTPVPPAKRFPSYLLPLRETRRPLSRVSLIRTHRRGPARSVNTP